MDYTTGEPVPSFIVCTRGPRDQCPCPFETCPCGAPVAVAELVPAPGPGAYLPVARGSYGTGGLEVWSYRGCMYVRELADGEQPREGRWRGASHEPDCPRRGKWRDDRQKVMAGA